MNEKYSKVQPALWGKKDLNSIANSGATAERPANPVVSQTFFDTTLGIPIWFDGTNWINAAGATV